jgi:hypothetical protein
VVSPASTAQLFANASAKCVSYVPARTVRRRARGGETRGCLGGPFRPDELDDGRTERTVESIDRAYAIDVVRDDLREQRVVIGRDGVPLPYTGFDAQSGVAGRPGDAGEIPRLGDEALGRIFGIDANFDGVAASGCTRGKLAGQRFARCHPELLLDQIETRAHLGHRMLDLKASVDLEKECIAPFVDDELARTHPDVTRAAEHPQGGFLEGSPPRRPSSPAKNQRAMAILRRSSDDVAARCTHARPG